MVSTCSLYTYIVFYSLSTGAYIMIPLQVLYMSYGCFFLLVEMSSGPSKNPVPASSPQPSYESSPSVGLIPNNPPPLTTSYSVTPSSGSQNFDPEHGIGPGTPPPSSQGRHFDPHPMPPAEAHITSGTCTTVQ